MKKYIYILVSAFWLAACCPTQIAPTVSMDRDALVAKNWAVAVVDLNYEYEEKGRTSITRYASAGEDGGRVVASLLAAELAKVEHFQMIERERIKKVLEEQAMQQSGAIDTASAIQIGQLVGAEAVVLGDLTDNTVWDNAAGFGSTISFAIRMVDVQSGRVLWNSAISRARPYVDSFPNAQLTVREAVANVVKQ